MPAHSPSWPDGFASVTRRVRPGKDGECADMGSMVTAAIDPNAPSEQRSSAYGCRTAVTWRGAQALGGERRPRNMPKIK